MILYSNFKSKSRIKKKLTNKKSKIQTKRLVTFMNKFNLSRQRCNKFNNRTLMLKFRLRHQTLI